MIDFALIVGFDWDDGNKRKSSDKHSVGQMEAEQVFVDSRLLITVDEKHSHAEPRFHALGATAGGRLLHLSFTLRENGSKIRVISARAANRQERKIYETEA